MKKRFFKKSLTSVLIFLGISFCLPVSIWARIPNNPTNLTATILNNDSIVLYWNDLANDESGFKIERKIDDGTWQEIARAGANAQSFNRNVYVDYLNMTESTYYYRISAYNNSGYSGYSEAVATPIELISDGFDFPVGDSDGNGSYTKFGTNNLCTSGWRVDYDVASYTTTTGYIHQGEDWNGGCGGDTDRNQPVYASSTGRVVFAGYIPDTWGNVVLIAHKLPTNEIVYTQYAHLETVSVSPGFQVVRRQQVGTIGKGPNNNTYAAHLHFEIRKLSIATGNGITNLNSLRQQYYNPSNRVPDNTYSGETGFIEDNRILLNGGLNYEYLQFVNTLFDIIETNLFQYFPWWDSSETLNYQGVLYRYYYSDDNWIAAYEGMIWYKLGKYDWANSTLTLEQCYRIW